MRTQVVFVALGCMFLVGCSQVSLQQMRDDVSVQTDILKEQAQEKISQTKEKIAETKEKVGEKIAVLEERAKATREQLQQYAKEENVTTGGLSCLQEKKLTMYGAVNTCPLSHKQQEILGDQFAYVDCETNRSDCLAAGIKNMPTRKSSDGKSVEGVYTLEELEVEFCGN